MLLKAILRRTAAGIATLLIVSILVFIGTSVLPGDVAEIILGQMATPENLAALRAKLGLDLPAYLRYFYWLGDLLIGDLGVSKAGSGFGTVGTTISSMIDAIGPIINVIALNLAWLVGGVVIVETVFAYPGLAKLMIDGVQTRDLPLVQACAMIFCATYVVLIFIADMASILSNPRLRHPK